jgi:ClpP class serine protease
MPEKTYAFSAGQMCSAAFWMACGCDTVLATPTASVGSIGVVCSILDQSAAYAARGESVNVFQSGDLKSTGIPGKPLTAEQCAHLQAQVDEIFGMFKSHVQTNRPGVKAEAFRGQSVFGAQAKALGLVDHIVSSFESVSLSVGLCRRILTPPRCQNHSTPDTPRRFSKRTAAPLLKNSASSKKRSGSKTPGAEFFLNL